MTTSKSRRCWTAAGCHSNNADSSRDIDYYDVGPSGHLEGSGSAGSRSTSSRAGVGQNHHALADKWNPPAVLKDRGPSPPQARARPRRSTSRCWRHSRALALGTRRGGLGGMSSARPCVVASLKPSMAHRVCGNLLRSSKPASGINLARIRALSCGGAR